MKLLRWCRWYDADVHEQVARELADRDQDIVDMAKRLAVIEAEIYPYGRPRPDRDRK